MFNIYKYDNYQDFLKDIVAASTQEKNKANSAVSLANCLGVSSPTFSKMINGSLVLQEDHVYLLAQHLKLSEDESNYLSLLGEIQRSGLESRKKNLNLRRIEIQRQNHNTPQTLKTTQIDFENIQDEAQYYANPWAPIIHVYLTIPKYQADHSLLGKELGLSLIFIENTLDLLKKIGLVEKTTQGYWMPLTRSLHSSNLSYLTSAQQILTRAISLQRLSTQNLSDRYSLSVTFSTDPDIHEQCRRILIESVDRIHKLVINSKPEDVYHLTVDLFNWSQTLTK